MPNLNELFAKVKVMMYHNESLDLDHYYQEPFQDQGDEIQEMDEPFETDKSRKKRIIEFDYQDQAYSNFLYFMDGSRRTYKIGDIVLGGKEIYPIVVAQIRAGSTQRVNKKIQSYNLSRKNLLLISSRLNDVDFEEIRQRLKKTDLAKSIDLEIVQYKFDQQKDIVPVNAAIAKANSMMQNMEIDIITSMVESKCLDTDKMLLVDGPLQFIAQDTGKPRFADLFYNVVGVSKSFDPMLPMSNKSRRGGTQIGTELLKLDIGERTPVFMKQNSRGRKFGCWYLRIRPRNRVHNPLDGIIKIEKMAILEDENGLDSSVVDTLSQSLLNESLPTAFGRDARWANHLYPVYLTETLIKSTFESDLVFINNFNRDFK